MKFNQFNKSKDNGGHSGQESKVDRTQQHTEWGGKGDSEMWQRGVVQQGFKHDRELVFNE